VHLELRELKDGCLEQQYCCAPERFPILKDFQENGQVRFEQPIDFQLRLQKSGQIVEVDGRLKTQAGFVCGRCLQPFEAEIQSAFALTFTPLSSAQEHNSDEDVELEADELNLIYYQDDQLDLLEPLQEQIILALPISPVCDTACLGLCPVCGGDLNIKKCSCEKKPFNSKFSTLAGLKIDQEEP